MIFCLPHEAYGQVAVAVSVMVTEVVAVALTVTVALPGTMVVVSVAVALGAAAMLNPASFPWLDSNMSGWWLTYPKNMKASWDDDYSQLNGKTKKHTSKPPTGCVGSPKQCCVC